MYEPGQTDYPKQYQKLCANVAEFLGYIHHNAYFIPCYSDRYFYGEPISTTFVESAVTKLVSRWMVKKQQMRWTKKEAHRLLQVRAKVLEGEPKERFKYWYPGMKAVESELPLAV